MLVSKMSGERLRPAAGGEKTKKQGKRDARTEDFAQRPDFRGYSCSGGFPANRGNLKIGAQSFLFVTM